jgi:hypothetical protein
LRRSAPFTLGLLFARKLRRSLHQFYARTVLRSWLGSLLRCFGSAGRITVGGAAWGIRRLVELDRIERRRPASIPVPKHPWLRTGVLALDVAAFNVVYYFLVRAALFKSANFEGGEWVAAWALGFAAINIGLGRVPLQGRRQSPSQTAVLLVLCYAAALFLWRINQRQPEEGDAWFLSEMIKFPLWTAMLARLSPVFTGAYVLAIVALMRWTAATGGSWAAIALFAVAFSGYGYDAASIWWLLFVAPVFVILVAGMAEWRRLAFRTAPAALTTLLMGLNYVGTLPAHAADLFPWSDPAAALQRIPGARLIYQPTAAEARTDFRFSRKLVRLDGKVVLIAGPMGDTRILTVDERTGEKLVGVRFRGLIRDALVSPDRTALWATNWQSAELVEISPSTLTWDCRVGLNQQRLLTPWSIRIAGDHLYMTNMIPPFLAEFQIPLDGRACGLRPTNLLNFNAVGYAPFADGAYGLDVDLTGRRAWATVGMLEGRYAIGLVEIDLDRFAIRRDLRLPSGVTITTLPGMHRALLTSYYYPEIFEVDLDRYELVRTIKAAANIFSLAYDDKRGLIYGTSRSGGVLQVIDYATGKLVREDVIGNKPEPLLMEDDRLFIASRWGIVEIDLTKYTGSSAPRQLAGAPADSR